MSIPSDIPNTRAEQPSRLNSSDELSSKAKALLGENYRQYSTADKLKILRIFTKPPRLENASGGQLDKVNEVSARYNRIEGDAEPLSLKAVKIVRASLPSYVQPMLFHWKLESFESALPKVTKNATDAAKQFASLSTETKLMLYGFSLCRKYASQLNERHGIATSYEKLKKSGGGMDSVDLGYEYKEAFNRQLRTYLPEEQSRVLEELEAEPSYDERKQKIDNEIEFALARLKGGASSKAGSATTTANTATTTTTTVTGTSLGPITSQRLSDMEIKQAASRISEPVNSLNHMTRLCLYLQYKAGTTTFSHITKYEDAALNAFEAQLKGETGKLDNPADKDALLNAVLEKVGDLLPEHLQNELSKINESESHTHEEKFKSLAYGIAVNVKTGSLVSNNIQSKLGATAILNAIGYSLDRDENRLSQMTLDEESHFSYACSNALLAEDPMKQQGFSCAFIEGLLSRAPETVQQRFGKALRILNPEETKKAVLDLVAEYLKDPSAIESPKKKD